jgi:hypothetical protein
MGKREREPEHVTIPRDKLAHHLTHAAIRYVNVYKALQQYQRHGYEEQQAKYLLEAQEAITWARELNSEIVAQILGKRAQFLSDFTELHLVV